MSIKSPDTAINPNKLKEARGNRSAQTVAEAIGISRQHLWQIETGRRTPGADILTKLLWLYGLNLADVAGGFTNDAKHRTA